MVLLWALFIGIAGISVVLVQRYHLSLYKPMFRGTPMAPLPIELHSRDKKTNDESGSHSGSDPHGREPKAVLHVRNLGKITFVLHPDVAPRTVANFAKMATTGIFNRSCF